MNIILGDRMTGMKKTTSLTKRIKEHSREYGVNPSLSIMAGHIHPFLTLMMSLEEYNALKFPMPPFLLGRQFDIVISQWEDECECDTCLYEGENTHPNIKRICAEFLFPIMIHEYYELEEETAVI